MYKEWASKINGKAPKNFSSKIFAASTASLINLCYPYEMHPSFQHLLIHFTIQYVDYHVKRVGVEKYLHGTLSGPQKKFPEKSEPDPPQVIKLIMTGVRNPCSWSVNESLNLLHRSLIFKGKPTVHVYFHSELRLVQYL